MENNVGLFQGYINIGDGYERAKGYWGADFNTLEGSMTTVVKTMKEPASCYKCGGLHFQNNCTNHRSNNSSKFQNTTSMWQNYKDN